MVTGIFLTTKIDRWLKKTVKTFDTITYETVAYMHVHDLALYYWFPAVACSHWLDSLPDTSGCSDHLTLYSGGEAIASISTTCYLQWNTQITLGSGIDLDYRGM